MNVLSVEAALALPGFALDATLEAHAGERMALFGPSGAGKSTLLSLIAGLSAPDRGIVTLDGRPLCDTARGVDVPPSRRRIALMFQDGALFPHLTVRENVAYGARGGSGAMEWLERLGLAALAARRPREISGGERQRVALARALASKPAALLLDEPFGALDVTTRGAVRHELRAFLEEARVPTVIVTHDPLDARVFGERVAVMEAGRIVQTGTWSEIEAAPRGPFAAGLAGLNFWNARLDPGRGLRAARVGAVEFHVLADDLEGEVYLALDPEEVTLAREAPHGSARNVLEATVRDLLVLGSRVRVRLDAGVPLSAEVTRQAAEALFLAPGQRVWASIKATAFRVYA